MAKKEKPNDPRIVRGATAWYIAWYDTDGNRQREKGGLNRITDPADREAVALEMLATIRARLSGQTTVKTKTAPVPLLPALRRMLLRKEAMTRKSTMQTYRSKFRTFERWAVAQRLGDADLRAFTDEQARAFMRSVGDRQPTTYNHYHDLLHNLFAAAIDEGLIQKNPFEKHDRRKPTPTPALYFPDEIRDRLAARPGASGKELHENTTPKAPVGVGPGCGAIQIV